MLLMNRVFHDKHRKLHAFKCSIFFCDLVEKGFVNSSVNKKSEWAKNNSSKYSMMSMRNMMNYAEQFEFIS